MIPVAEAQAAVLALAAPLPVETVPLIRAAGRVLAADVVAAADQPPFPAAAMDGYAVAAPARPRDRRRVIGTAQAGARFAGRVAPGEAVRIFTGAPVPEGAVQIVIQEDVAADGDTITIGPRVETAAYIRPRGADFHVGARIGAGRRLRPVDVALAAAMRAGTVTVRRRPVVAILPTGDELVMPGEPAGPDQIAASNVFALAAMAEAEGAEARLLPIARDDPAALAHGLTLAAGSDLIVTVGGASVGEHDLVRGVADRMGIDRAFYRIAMRPGKPLQAGRLGGAAFLGLPGNPVSAIVTGAVFMMPLIRAMLGLPALPDPAQGVLARGLAAEGPRTHYMRARLIPGAPARLDPYPDQDSARLRLLAEAEALVIRPAHAPAAHEGDPVAYLPL
jgi:molybdopterin molybdotransferase